MLTHERGVAAFRDTKHLSETDKMPLVDGTLQKSTNGKTIPIIGPRHTLAE